MFRIIVSAEFVSVVMTTLTLQSTRTQFRPWPVYHFTLMKKLWCTVLSAKKQNKTKTKQKKLIPLVSDKHWCSIKYDLNYAYCSWCWLLTHMITICMVKFPWIHLNLTLRCNPLKVLSHLPLPSPSHKKCWCKCWCCYWNKSNFFFIWILIL